MPPPPPGAAFSPTADQQPYMPLQRPPSALRVTALQGWRQWLPGAGLGRWGAVQWRVMRFDACDETRGGVGGEALG